MASLRPDRFVRFSTDLLEAFLGMPFSGTQWRILLWVVRQTYGWNRQFTNFTWYRMARDLALSRPAVFRSGKALLSAGILIEDEKRLAIQSDSRVWSRDVASARSADQRQLWMPGLNVASRQPPALPANNVAVAAKEHKRCQGETSFRRAKDSKDRLNTCPKIGAPQRRLSHGSSNGADKEHHPAGAARPVRGKYDSVS